MRDATLNIDAAATVEDLLADCFEEAHFGFRQFADIADLWCRAVLSDETRQAAAGVLTNLHETYIHEDLFRQRIGDGLPYAGTGSPGSVFREYDEAELHIAGFLRAFGSTLDCLAAVSFGVLRAGWNIRRADRGDVAQLDQPYKKIAREIVRPVPETQQKTWAEFIVLADAADAREPAGWLVWGLQARNAVVHRPRQLDLLSQLARAFPEGFVAISDDPVGSQLQSGRYKPHLLRRPWMSDMHDISLAGTANDLVFDEHADLTLMMLRMSLNDLVDSVARFLLDAWRLGEAGAFSSEPLVVAFVAGFQAEHRSAEFASRRSGTGLRTDSAAGHSELQRQVSVAQALKAAGHGPPDAV